LPLLDMNDLSAYLRAQVRKQPLDTLRFCVAEALRRRRLRGGVAPPLCELPADGLTARFAPFVPGPSATFASAMDTVRQFIVAQAERICRGEYEVFGRPARLGTALDWHADWVSGHRWPLAPPDRIALLDAAPGADIKRPWELGRFHHGIRLAQAWRLTGDARYTEAFAAQVEHWLRHNPCPQGIHWAMPMEVALRAVNWTQAAALLAEAPLESSFWRKWLAALHQHGEFVFAHREWNPVARGNHYLACVVGVLCAGIVFRDIADGRHWLEFGRRALRQEMAAQVDADGVAHEGSSGYHTFVAELMLTAALPVARLDALEHGRNGDSGSLRAQLTAAWGEDFGGKLERMLDFCAVLAQGRTGPPIWGDSDDGRVLPLCPSDADASQHLLALGRELFAREDWPVSHVCAEPLFRLGADSADAASPARPGAAVAATGAFPAAGFYFFASPRLRGSIRCGPLGVNGWANHAHGDQLHVEFCWAGQPILTDPGTYAYSGAPAERNRFRSTRAHNTPYIEDSEQNRFWEKLLFRMVDDTRARCLHWQASEAGVEFAGEHYGYRRLPQRVTVRRALRLDHARDTLLIRDALTGRGTVRVEWNFQLTPNLPVNSMDGQAGEQLAGPSGLAFHSGWKLGALALAVCCEAPANLTANIEAGWVAPRYGWREPAPLLRIAGRLPLPTRVEFLFSPFSEDSTS
jgi:hypothetical protein